MCGSVVMGDVVRLIVVLVLVAQLCSTAAPPNRPCARSDRARGACDIGYAVVVARMPNRAARRRNSSPSARVLAVTLRSCFSWNSSVS